MRQKHEGKIENEINPRYTFHRLAREHGLEGVVSKRINGRYEPGRRSWLKTKCLNREEFVVVGWSDPEGSRHRIGSLLLGYYTPDGKLIYAGRAGTGMPDVELERLWHRLRPLTVAKMPLSVPPPRGSRFGSPLVLSRAHWVRPEMVAEVSYAEWPLTGCSAMSSIWENGRTNRQAMFGGLFREDRPASSARTARVRAAATEAPQS